MSPSVVKPWLHLGLRFGLGAVFFYAGVIKLRDPRGFEASIASFQLVPASWIPLLAASLPFTEAIAGFWLMLGWRPRAPALALGLLTTGFLLALGQAWARGLAIDCGCFGSAPPSRGEAGLALARDLLVWAATCLIYAEAKRQDERSRPLPQ